MYEKKNLGFNKKIRTKLAFLPQQKTDTTAQLEKKFLQPTRSECICLSVILSVSKG